MINVIPGLGGIRKARFGALGKGKSGGVPVIYYYFDVRCWPFSSTEKTNRRI